MAQLYLVLRQNLKILHPQVCYTTRICVSCSDLAGLYKFCGRNRSVGISLGGIGCALFGGRRLGQLCEARIENERLDPLTCIQALWLKAKLIAWVMSVTGLGKAVSDHRVISARY